MSCFCSTANLAGGAVAPLTPGSVRVRLLPSNAWTAIRWKNTQTKVQLLIGTDYRDRDAFLAASTIPHCFKVHPNLTPSPLIRVKSWTRHRLRRVVPEQESRASGRPSPVGTCEALRSSPSHGKKRQSREWGQVYEVTRNEKHGKRLLR